MSLTIEATVKGLAVELKITTDLTGPLTVTRQQGTRPPKVVRGLDGVDAQPLLVVLDYEIPYGTTLTYRVTVGGVSASVTVTSPAESRAWLRDVLYPTKSVPTIITRSPTVALPSRSTVLRPVGRKNAVAVTDIRSGAEGTMTFATLTIAEADAMRSMIDSGNVLLLTGPASWNLAATYMVLLGVNPSRMGLADSPVRLWDCEYVEVDPPDALILGTPQTWQDYLSTYSSWQEMAGKTWADLQYPPGA